MTQSTSSTNTDSNVTDSKSADSSVTDPDVTEDNVTEGKSIAVLQQAASAWADAEAQRPNSSQLVEALVKTEQATKSSRVSLPVESLLGTWRLCFTANKASRQRSGAIEGNGRYLPRWIQASLSLSVPDQSDSDQSAPEKAARETTVPEAAYAQEQPLAIANQLKLGPLLLRLAGPAKHLGRKNLVAFDFTYITVRLLGLTLYSGRFPGRRSSAESFAHQKISALPFFAFVAATDGFIAARGRGGGLALWVDDRLSDA